ncbi:NodT family efflux transporter outer membrane factor (OMF) lipoprotein [Sphingomonas endophytica]|uniref:NodT family efflux transporter outer membrane factor (OMF) lipoprotein n=1 Tax=Sphingomonas endophytica TaxID=869719 RepID=A0A7X0JB85_9SPHN|nr:efflux transporter outer membrane subunit [Sphingomonas endophytica]MBB6504426.1 NodT family efflux transporter outer membrane factor (OMF) lipoprotein [Sphingomonas endophytica]
MRHALPLVTLALLGACTVGPDYKGPPAVASDAVTRGTFVRAADPALTPAPGLARWWETLADPTLNALVDDALAHSPTIDAAQANLRIAQEQYRQQRAARLPSVSASAVYLNARLPGTNLGGGQQGGGDSDTTLDFYNLGAMASWEPDLFGGGRRTLEQQRATEGQRFAQLADAQVTLSAQVAQAYVALRDAQARARLNAQSSALQRRQLTLVEQRYAAGTASQLQVERLRNQLNSTDAQTIPLAAQIDEYKGQLAVLTGRAPGALDPTLATVVAVPLPPAQVPIGDPAALLQHRPDIRAAERALAAGNAQIGVATARKFPSLNLLGIIGLGGTGVSDVLDPSKLATVAAPMLNWSFLDFGRNRAAVRQAEAQRDAADAQYRQTVLEALQDAETSLSRFGNARQQLAQLLLAEQSATRAAGLNAQRVEAGTSTLVDQLDIERQRLSATIGAEQGRAQLTNHYIAVQKSLGLGWTDPAASARR